MQSSIEEDTLEVDRSHLSLAINITKLEPTKKRKKETAHEYMAHRFGNRCQADGKDMGKVEKISQNRDAYATEIEVTPLSNAISRYLYLINSFHSFLQEFQTKLNMLM